MTLKLAVSRSRPSVLYGSNFCISDLKLEFFKNQILIRMSKKSAVDIWCYWCCNWRLVYWAIPSLCDISSITINSLLNVQVSCTERCVYKDGGSRSASILLWPSDQPDCSEAQCEGISVAVNLTVLMMSILPNFAPHFTDMSLLLLLLSIRQLLTRVYF